MANKKDIKYSQLCGCCPIGVITYPNSIEDIFNTDCHYEFLENFQMFLRIMKDKNFSPMQFDDRKFEQRIAFGSMISRIGKGLDDKDTTFVLPGVGRRFFDGVSGRWDDGLLEGFEEAPAVIEHLKSHSRNYSTILRKDIIGAAYRWVVEQIDQTLTEYKAFRDGMSTKERENWDKRVKDQNKKWVKDEGVCGDSWFDGITKEEWNERKKKEDVVRQLLENISPGFCIGEGKAKLNSQCWSCHTAGKKLLQCSRCSNASYCDRDCQVRDWPQHKGYCNNVRKMRKKEQAKFSATDLD